MQRIHDEQLRETAIVAIGHDMSDFFNVRHKTARAT